MVHPFTVVIYLKIISAWYVQPEYDTVCNVFKLEIDGDSGLPAMIGAVQTFGDLVHWHSHIQAIVAEGVFTDSGYFVHIPEIWKYRAAEFWQERVFRFLLNEHKINDDIAGNIRSWKHSGFSVDTAQKLQKNGELWHRIFLRS